MCPLRVILLFLSALLAGYFAFTSVTSNNSTKPGGGGVSDATDEVLQVGSADDRSLVEGGNQNDCKKWKILVEQSEAARQEAFCRGYYEGREGMKMLDFRLQTAGSILNKKGLWQWRKSRTVL